MSTLNAFYVAFGIKSNLKFVSTIEGKRQRLIWEFENSGVYGVLNYVSIEILAYGNKDHTYIEDKESNKSLKCFHYTIELPAKDGKNRVIGYYFDQYGNIKSKNIKFNLIEKALKDQGVDLREYYFKSAYIETITTSLGYDLEDLPHSCQKGKGEFFKCIDPFTKMYLLKYGNKIKARCYVWDEGTITFTGKDLEYSNNTKLADRIYAVDGYWKGEMVKKLKEKGIKLIWSEDQDCIEIADNYKAYVDVRYEKDLIDTHIIKDKTPWLDSFNNYDSTTYKLYLYDWKTSGHDVEENEINFSLTTYVFLSQDGSQFTQDNFNLVYDDLTGELIEEEDAVYVSLGSWTGTTKSWNTVWSEYHSGYILERDAYEMIVGDDVDYTYDGSGVSLVDINGQAYLVSGLDIYHA